MRLDLWLAQMNPLALSANCRAYKKSFGDKLIVINKTTVTNQPFKQAKRIKWVKYSQETRVMVDKLLENHCLAAKGKLIRNVIPQDSKYHRCRAENFGMVFRDPFR